MATTKILMTNGSLMKVESIAERSPQSSLQYFWPALNNNWSWKPIFGLFYSGHFTQVLQLYVSLLNLQISMPQILSGLQYNAASTWLQTCTSWCMLIKIILRPKTS